MFFSTVWGWIKRWFDPVTVSKIFILSQSEVLPTLKSFIDTQNIPKQYGGELDFQWCQMPNLDPKIKELATWENGHTDFPKGPLYWVPIEGGKKLEALARGSVDKKDRNVRVCTIPVAFAEEEKKAPVLENGEAVVSVPPPTIETAVAQEAAAVADDSAKEVPGSPIDEEFKDAPEEPVKSAPITEIQGVQNLSLKDEEPISEKAAEVEAVLNGKAVA